MKFTVTVQAPPRITVKPPPAYTIGQPFVKGAVKLNDEELKAVGLANLDRTIRYNLTDCGRFLPGEPDPEPRSLSDSEVVDRVVESVTADLAYNENLTLGLRALGGLSALPALILQRIPLVRAREASRPSLGVGKSL